MLKIILEPCYRSLASNRKLIVSSFFILVLTSITLSSYALKSPSAGVVVFSSGEIQLVRNEVVRELKRRGDIYEGDRIITGTKSRVKLRMIDGTVMMLGAETTFVVNHYEYSKQDNKGSASLALFKGVMRTVTGAIGKTKERDFLVKTPVGTIGIRGTDFWVGDIFSDAFDVALMSDKGVYVQNSAGRVEITKTGYGTTIEGINIMPTKPKLWGEKKYQMALDSVFIDESVR